MIRFDYFTLRTKARPGLWGAATQAMQLGSKAVRVVPPRKAWAALVRRPRTPLAKTKLPTELLEIPSRRADKQIDTS